jgi:hypothetical protein
MLRVRHRCSDPYLTRSNISIYLHKTSDWFLLQQRLTERRKWQTKQRGDVTRFSVERVCSLGIAEGSSRRVILRFSWWHTVTVIGMWRHVACTMFTDFFGESAASIIRTEETEKMERACSSETALNICQTMWRHISSKSNLRTSGCLFIYVK